MPKIFILYKYERKMWLFLHIYGIRATLLIFCYSNTINLTNHKREIV